MTYRLYDWYCTMCGHVQEILTWVERGAKVAKILTAPCPECRDAQEHHRQISLPARYTGEDSYVPSISGGRFDTNGYVQHARPKEFDLRSCFDQTKPENRDKAEAVTTSKDYREWKRERADVVSNNAAKRKREAAIKSGANINLKNKADRLPGDPVKHLKPGAT